MTIIVSAPDWGAEPPTKYPYPIRDDQPIGVHIHWLGDKYDPAWPDEQILRSVQAYHQGTKKWSDIGYSHAVGRSARLFDCRGWGVVGAHTHGFNSTSHGLVFLIGEGETPTDEMLAAGMAYLELAKLRGQLAYVRPHSAAKATKCPGPELTAWAESIDVAKVGQRSVNGHSFTDQKHLIARLQAAVNSIGYQPPLAESGVADLATVEAVEDLLRSRSAMEAQLGEVSADLEFARGRVEQLKKATDTDERRRLLTSAVASLRSIRTDLETNAASLKALADGLTHPTDPQEQPS